jgi:GTP-binding protein
VRRRSPPRPVAGLPIIAVVGRPNVGKSTLFNRILGTRAAIVEDRARTTRDRLYGEAEWNGRRFVVVDTGGLERRPGDEIEARVQEQARLAIHEADLILFVVDASAGETAGDQEAAELLRAASVPVIVAVNKADNARREQEGAEFHRLGWDETYAISALHGRGTGDLLDAVVWALPAESEAEQERKRLEAEAEEGWPELPELLDGSSGEAANSEHAAWDLQAREDAERAKQPIAVAIVGRPNVGKSSLLNALLGEERMIVSEVPGTTRDAIDTQIEWGGQRITLIDTAGMRRRGRMANGPAAERYSGLRALRALGRADVAVLVVDAADDFTRQDAHVAGYAIEEGKGLVVAINKWDLVEKEGRTFDGFVDHLRREAPFLDFAPVVSISAKTGQRVGRVLDLAVEIAAERRRRVPTAELNRLLSEAAFQQQPPAVKGKRLKFYYATQAAVRPPTFVLFVNDADAVHFSYSRYLENRIREALDFGGTPIRMVFRTRTRAQLERRRPRRVPATARGHARAPGRPAARGTRA